MGLSNTSPRVAGRKYQLLLYTYIGYIVAVTAYLSYYTVLSGLKGEPPLESLKFTFASIAFVVMGIVLILIPTAMGILDRRCKHGSV